MPVLAQAVAPEQLTRASWWQQALSSRPLSWDLILMSPESLLGLSKPFATFEGSSPSGIAGGTWRHPGDSLGSVMET